MKKIGLGLLLLFTSINSKEYWQCDTAGKVVCAATQTCCRSKVNVSGWECFPTIQGVCCSNGINCCPKGTVCDLSAMTCRPISSLSFLTSSELATENNLIGSDPIIEEIPLVPTGEFLEGFFKGFDLFSQTTDGNTCLTNQDFGNYIADVLNKLRTIKLDENFFKVLEELAADIKNKKDLIVNEMAQCKIFGENVKVILDKIAVKVEDPKYSEKVLGHALMNMSKIKESFEQLKPLYDAHDYQLLGKSAGELIKFVFFWDL